MANICYMCKGWPTTGHPLRQLGGVAPAALPNLYSTHHVEACYVDGPSPMLKYSDAIYSNSKDNLSSRD